MAFKVIFVRGQKVFLLNTGVGIAGFTERRELINKNRRGGKQGELPQRPGVRKQKISYSFSRVFFSCTFSLHQLYIFKIKQGQANRQPGNTNARKKKEP